MWKLHQKNPLIAIVVTFALGITAAKFIIPYPLSLWLLISISLLTILFFLNSLLKKYIAFWLLAALFLAGTVRLHVAAWVLPGHHLLNQDLMQMDWVEGSILETHYAQEKYDCYLLAAEKLHKAGATVHVCGKILFRLPVDLRKFPYGQKLRIFGQLGIPPPKRNPGQFNYQAYLAAQDIYHVYENGQIDSIIYLGTGARNWFLCGLINPLRDYCSTQFNHYLKVPTAGLLNALITGEKQDLNQETINRFKELGVIHVLAISGLHVGYIILFVFTLFSVLRFSQKYKIMGLGLVLIIYVTLVHFISPVLRAALMAVLFLLGEMYERKVSAYNILAGAALLILIWEPRELFQVGFQFSFLGILSLIYGPEKVEQLLPVGRLLQNTYADSTVIHYFLKWIWYPLRVSIAAVLINIPLTVYYYGAIPTYAVLANLIVIPAVGIIVFLGIFLLLGAGLSHWLAAGIGGIINLLDQILSRIVKIISGFPGSYINVPYPAFWHVALWTVIAFLVLNSKNIRARKSLIIVLLMYSIYLICTLERSREKIQAAFLDVGQGDAGCLIFPNRHLIIIDAGDKVGEWDSGQNTVLPYLKSVGILHAQYAVLSHPHDDHIAGFYSLLQIINLDTLVVSRYHYPSQTYSELLSLCRGRGIFVRYVQKGDWLYPDPSCRVYIFHPDSSYTALTGNDGATCNNNSIVLKVQYGQNGILYLGDLQKEAEESILFYNDFLECEILKAAHHGAANATSVNLLNEVQPLCAVISVARKNKFNHPSALTLDRLNNLQICTYQTSKQGAVIFEITMHGIRKVDWH